LTHGLLLTGASTSQPENSLTEKIRCGLATEPLLPSAPDRARGALLGTFVGDALGMPFEGVSHTDVPAAVDMVAARRGRGTYTDDTQMMIALAESLIERR
jgi:hypothetical protein